MSRLSQRYKDKVSGMRPNLLGKFKNRTAHTSMTGSFYQNHPPFEEQSSYSVISSRNGGKSVHNYYDNNDETYLSKLQEPPFQSFQLKKEESNN